MDYAAPLKLARGRLSVSVSPPLTSRSGSLEVDLGQLAQDLAGPGLRAVSDRLEIQAAFPVAPPSAALSQAIGSPPTQAQVQAIQDKVNELQGVLEDLLNSMALVGLLRRT